MNGIITELQRQVFKGMVQEEKGALYPFDHTGTAVFEALSVRAAVSFDVVVDAAGLPKAINVVPLGGPGSVYV